MNTNYEEEKIKVNIESIVKKNIEKELSLIKSVGGFSLKALGVFVAVLLGIFTVLGFTTLSDLKREASEYTRQEVNNIIKSDSHNGGVKKRLDDLVNLSIINSYLIKKIKLNTSFYKNSKVYNRRVLISELTEKDIQYIIEKNEKIRLKDNEWSRLKNWIKEESLGLQEFKDVLNLLNEQNDDRKEIDSYQLLSEMLTPEKGSPYFWMKKQPEKRYAILNGFKHKSMGRSVVKLFSSSFNPEDMRVSAINYIKNINYIEGFNEIITTVQNLNHGKLWLESLYVFSSIKPLDSRFKKELDHIINNSNEKYNIVKILNGLQYFTNNKINYEPLALNREEKIEIEKMANKLINLLVELNFFPYVYNSIYRSNDRWTGAHVVFENKRKDFRVKFGSTGEFILLGYYWSFLENIVNKGEIEKFKMMVPRTPNMGFIGPSKVDQPFYINVKLGESSKVVVSQRYGNKTFDLTKDSASRIHLMPRHADSEDIEIGWEGEREKLEYGIFREFVGNSIRLIPKPLVMDKEFDGFTKSYIRRKAKRLKKKVSY